MIYKPRILAVDDDSGILKYVRANLQTSGYEVLLANNGSEAINLLENEIPDLIILDITMPLMDGITVCETVRQWSKVPIIMLSACRDVKEKIRCLESGADDYIVKPFGVEELRARVKAVLRRSGKSGSVLTKTNFTYCDLNVDFVQRKVTLGSQELKLTPTEYLLLKELVLNPGTIFPHSVLLDKIWGSDYTEAIKYLHVFMGRLRHLLEDDAQNPKYIITIPGVGYQFHMAG
ncbi:MAG: response regulator transcription factor [Chloroflexi bacterium]|nr:response regulator transcription factor [Chloroflexota bacterium]